MATIETEFIFSVIDFSGVFVGGVGGAIEAARNSTYEYDVVGVTGLALASALGGGITRDIILQHGPPLAFMDARYLLVALAGALAALVFGPKLGIRTQKSLSFIDAAALGLFAVAGSTRALDAGLTTLPAILLGVVTAVGGGSIRDVLSGRTPKVFERGQLYAVAAAFASLTFLGCNALHLTRSTSTALGAGCGFTLRLLAVHYDWQTQPVKRIFGK